MSDNPLSTPLFSRAGVTLATFLGSPLAGTAVLALNYRRLNQPRLARLSLVWGVVSTIVIVIVAFLLPEKFPSIAISAAYTYTMYNVATSLQWRTYTSHVERGGARASIWMAAAIGVGGLCIVVGIIVAFAFVLPEHWIPE